MITGGEGFIGSELLKIVKRDDIILLSLHGKKHPKYEVVKGDITKPNILKNIAKDVDTVVHLAGVVSYSKSREELFKINAEATKNVLDACKNVDRFVFASSVSVIGKMNEKVNESTEPKPFTAYGDSKLQAEKYVKDSGIDHATLRFAPVYGKGSAQWVKNLKLLEKGFPIPKADNPTHVLHVTNAAKALELSIKKGKGVYLIADEKPVNFIQLAEKIVKLLGKKPKKVSLRLAKLMATMKGMRTYMDVLTMYRHYDISNAKEIGYTGKIDLDKKLKEMVDWYLKTNK